MLDNSSIKEFIDSNWGNICNIAYRSYLELGRGLIGIKMTINKEAGNREAKMVYGVFKDDSQIDKATLKMIDSYNPDTEFLVQYLSNNGKAQTAKIEAGENKGPKEIWQEMNQPSEESENNDD